MTTDLLVATYLRQAGGDKTQALVNARYTLKIKESTGEQSELRRRMIESLKEVINQLEESDS